MLLIEALSNPLKNMGAQDPLYISICTGLEIEETKKNGVHSTHKCNSHSQSHIAFKVNFQFIQINNFYCIKPLTTNGL